MGIRWHDPVAPGSWLAVHIIQSLSYRSEDEASSALHFLSVTSNILEREATLK